MADDASRPKKAAITPGAWQEARALIYAHRKRLSLGFVLLLVNRVAGFVLPASPKWVIDRVIGQHRPEVLLPLALALVVLCVLSWRLTAIAMLIVACFGAGMALAFTRLRPLFRERGKINAEVTGRLAETLGGIRIVKAYHAERSERLVFTRGANTMFRNNPATMPGISSLGPFATLIVGAIGILMILEGGRSVLAGAMTLGDLFMYGIFVGLVAMPLINIASIGTQITEAFAGLDRIREIRKLVTEDSEDGVRAPVGDVRGDVVFADV